MKATTHTILLAAIAVVLAALPLFPQAVNPAPTKFIGADGWVELNGVTVPPGLHGLEVKAGDVVRTGWGRAGVGLGPGLTLHVGERSAVRLATGQSGESRIDLIEGTIVFYDSRRGSEGRTTAVVAYRDVEISSLGTSAYRVDTNPAELRVRRGKVLVQSGGRRVEVGESRTLALDGSLAVGMFRQSKTDSLDLWLSRPVGYSMPPIAASGSPSVAKSPSVFFTFAGGPVFLNDYGFWQGGQEPPGIAELDTLRTTQGQAEIRLNPFTHLFLGEESSIRMISARSPEFAFELVRGTVVLRAAKESAVVIARGGEKISFLKPGLYRLDAEPAELRVFAGQAVAESGGQRLNVGAGKMAVLAGVLAASGFDRDGADALGLGPAWQAAHRRTPPRGPVASNGGSGIVMQREVQFGVRSSFPDIGVHP